MNVTSFSLVQHLRQAAFGSRRSMVHRLHRQLGDWGLRPRPGSSGASYGRALCGGATRGRDVQLPLATRRGISTSSPSTPSESLSSTSTSLAPLPLPRSLAPRSALLILRVPVPPKHWPSHLDLASPLLLQLTTALKRVQRPSFPSSSSTSPDDPASRSPAPPIAVNAVWDGIGTSEFFGGIRGEEAYPAEIYWPDGSRTVYDRLDSRVIRDGRVQRDVESQQVDWEVALRPDVEAAGSGGGFNADSGEGMREEPGNHVQEVLVCTHGSRDCRCEQHGGALVTALRKEITRRGLEEVIRVSEIAHVGGHKYAANALLLPSLDMLSNLSPTDAPALVDFLVAGRPRDGQMWGHWRGRMGLSEEAQRGVWNSVAAAHVEEKLVEDGKEVSASMGAGTAATGQTTLDKSPDKGIEIPLRFKTYQGDVIEVIAKTGESLLQVARKNDLPAMEGTCGGNLECATCHLYLSSSAPVPPETESELDMLGYALGYVEGESRLGCQIKVTAELSEWMAGGGVIRLPRF